MKKITILFFTVLFSVIVMAQTGKTLHSFETKTVDGKPFKLDQLKGKKVLVVNVASKCGLTPQYEELEKLYKKYGGDKFIIIGFPANNFLSQEPGTNAEIKEFCTKNYGVTFPIMSKISVVGDDIDPIYKWLTLKNENGVMDAPVSWNFQKFMIDENGKLVDFAKPKDKPMSEKIITWIEGK
jgi:glutathione peroxidase